MKNIALNKLTYTGIVTLSQYIGAKKVKIAQFHNTGGSALFDFFIACLIEENLDTLKSRRPKKVRLVQRYLNGETAEEGYFYRAASGFIFMRTNGESKKPGQVRYQFTISRDQLDAVSDYNNLGLGLYSQNATEEDVKNGNYLAFCMLNFSRNALANSALVVDWELTIANGGENATNR
jgi:hypothetical protein